MAGYLPYSNDWVLMYNNYTGSHTYLSAINPTSGGLLEMSAGTSSAAYWQILKIDGAYHIRNKAAGSTFQLDVIYSNQVPMPSLLREDPSAQGQQWRVIANSIFYNIESDGPGSNVQLDTYSDTLQPFFENGGHSGQLWSFSSVGLINDATFSTVGGAQTSQTSTASATSTETASQSSGSTTESQTGTSTAPTANTQTKNPTATSNPTSLSSNSSKPALSSGAIAGIAVGATVIGMLLVTAIGIFFWRRRARNSSQAHSSDPSTSVEYVGRAEIAGDQSYHPSKAGEKALGNMPMLNTAELRGGDVRPPAPIAELSAHD